MHLELVELLRCPVLHEDSVLVALAYEVEARYILQGALGCPVCGAEYAIVNGVTHLGAESLTESVEENVGYGSAGTSKHDMKHGEANSDGNDVAIDSSAIAEAPFILAAQLGLSEGRSVFVTVGHSIAVIHGMRAIVPARLLVINPPEVLPVNPDEPPDTRNFAALKFIQASINVAPFGIISAATMPLVNGKFDGAAVTVDSSSYVAAAANALRSRGRMVAPIATALPAGMNELVRDSSVWVAERESMPSAPVALRRNRETMTPRPPNTTHQ